MAPNPLPPTSGSVEERQRIPTREGAAYVRTCSRQSLTRKSAPHAPAKLERSAVLCRPVEGVNLGRICPAEGADGEFRLQSDFAREPGTKALGRPQGRSRQLKHRDRGAL